MKVKLPAKSRMPLLIVAALVLILPLSRFLLFISTPLGSGDNTLLFDFRQGETLRSIASSLYEQKIIGSSAMFVLYARLHGDAGRLQAGYYRLNNGMTPADILRKMVSGEVYVERFTVPEGYSIFQIAELIAARRLLPKGEFIKECFSKPLLKELGIDGNSAEGYLYPSTYEISPGMTPDELIRMMVAMFAKVYERDFAAAAAEKHLSRRQIVILASMIEKEAVKPEERSIIASVFRNRIRIGMPLQSDPTAVYGVRAFAGNVSKRDISRNTPYNTYLISGLPPGPIGNPGSAALEAVINPAETDYLYFVAKKDGSHHFSRTLKEHNMAVRTYLKS